MKTYPIIIRESVRLTWEIFYPFYLGKENLSNTMMFYTCYWIPNLLYQLLFYAYG